MPPDSILNDVFLYFYNLFIKILGLNEKMFMIYLALDKYSTNGIFLEQLNREFMY